MQSQLLNKIQAFLESSEAMVSERVTTTVSSHAPAATTTIPTASYNIIHQKQQLLDTGYHLLKKLLNTFMFQLDEQHQQQNQSIEAISRLRLEHLFDQTSMKNKLQEIEQRRETTERHLIEMSEKMENLEDEVQQLSNQCQELRETNCVLEQDVSSYKETIQKLKREKSTIQTQHDVDWQLIKNENQALLGKTDKMQKEIKNLEEQTAILRFQNQILIQKYHACEEQLQILRHKPTVEIKRLRLQSVLSEDKENLPPSNVKTWTKSPRTNMKQTQEKQCLNNLCLKDSEDQFNTVINIQQQVVDFCSPRRSEQPSQIDPYHCFFLLLVQCAKLNCSNFEKAAQINMNDMWQILVGGKVPMNIWSKTIEKVLSQRIN